MCELEWYRVSYPCVSERCSENARFFLCLGVFGKNAHAFDTHSVHGLVNEKGGMVV
jgi:hypothetical protein